MAQFKYDCVHCRAAGAGFSVRFQWPSRHTGNLGQILAICGICDRGMIVELRALNWTSFPNLVGEQHDIGSNLFPIIQTWPSSSRMTPSNVPDSVVRFYEQGVTSLLAENWDAAGSMFRKTLDVATKILREDLKSQSLFTRINEMVASHDLTPAMGEWSHHIRLDGNSAVHDEDPETEEDAVVLKRFTEAFLTYSFSLPALVEANRAKHQPANDAASAA